MSDEGTASTLVSVAAYLQLVFWLVGLGAILFFIFMLMPIFYIDFLMMLMIFGVVLLVYALITIFGLIFMILWFRWRSEPSQHKTGLIVTGILGLFLAGFIPGLLALIAGIIVPSVEEKVGAIPSAPPRKPVEAPKKANVCPHCGTPVLDPSARFCANCGASIE